MPIKVEALPDGRKRAYDERSGIEGIGVTQAEAVSKAQAAFKCQELENQAQQHQAEAEERTRGIGRKRARALLLSEIKSLHNAYMKGVRQSKLKQRSGDVRGSVVRLRARRKTIWRLLDSLRFLTAVSTVPTDAEANRIIHAVQNIIEAAPLPNDVPLLKEEAIKKMGEHKKGEELRNKLFTTLDETSKAFRFTPEELELFGTLHLQAESSASEYKEFYYYFRRSQRVIEHLKLEFDEALRIESSNNKIWNRTFLGSNILTNERYIPLPNGVWSVFKRRGRAAKPDGAVRALLCRLFDKALPDCGEHFALIAELVTSSGMATNSKQVRSILTQ